MADVTTGATLLKRTYDSMILEAVNQEGLVWELFTEDTENWNGQDWRVPVHVQRASGDVQEIADGGAYPAPADETVVHLIVDTQTIAGTKHLTRNLMKRARSSGTGAFVNIVNFQADHLKKNLLALLNRRAISGGHIKGFLNEQKTFPATSTALGANFTSRDAITLLGTTFEYFGDFTPFASCVEATTASWVRIQFYRTDTFAEVNLSDNSNILHFFVSSADADAGTLNLRAVWNANADTFSLAISAAGFAIAIGLHATQSTLNAVNVGTVVSTALQPIGIFDNLANPTHWQVDRTTATGYTTLQPTIITQVIVAPQARAAVTPARMQNVKDRINDKSGADTDLVLINSLTRSAYLGAATGSIQLNLPGSAGKIDVGGKSFSFAGDTFRVSQYVPKGGYIFLTKACWKYIQLGPIEFVKQGGKMLIFDGVTAAHKMVVEIDYNLYCQMPNENGILCGTAL